MKRFLSYILMFAFTLITMAQEAEEAVRVRKGWSDDTKIILMLVFALLCVVLAARTFRNKPEA